MPNAAQNRELMESSVSMDPHNCLGKAARYNFRHTYLILYTD
jgi:hypothetical protein